MAAIQDLWYDRKGNRKPVRKNVGRYQVRWKEPSGKARTRTFARKRDAELFLATTVADLERGTYRAPTRRTFGDVAETWLRTRRSLTPATRAGYETLYRSHIIPALGGFEVAAILHSDIQEFVTNLETKLAPGSVRNAYFLVRSILNRAIRDGNISSNPALEVSLPEIPHAEVEPIDAAQVESLASSIFGPYRELVLFAAYTGLRAGEIGALKARNLDLLHRVVHVRESMTYVERQGYVTGPTKNKQNRSVPLAPFLARLLAAYTAGRQPDDYVFLNAQGNHIKHRSFTKEYFAPAVERLNLQLRFHDLRHTTASLLIQLGAHPKEVCDYLGHSTITITMDRYGHLFPLALDKLAIGLDAVRADATPASNVRELRG